MFTNIMDGKTSYLVFFLTLLIHLTVLSRNRQQALPIMCKWSESKIAEAKILNSFKNETIVRQFIKNKETEKKLLSLLKMKFSKIKEKEQNCWFLRSG